MRQRLSKEKQLPSLIKTGVMDDFSLVARKMAVAGKAIEQVRLIENKLMAERDNISEERFKLAMNETAKYSRMAADASRGAILILKKMKPQMEGYQKELKNAVS